MSDATREYHARQFLRLLESRNTPHPNEAALRAQIAKHLPAERKRPSRDERGGAR